MTIFRHSGLSWISGSAWTVLLRKFLETRGNRTFPRMSTMYCCRFNTSYFSHRTAASYICTITHQHVTHASKHGSFPSRPACSDLIFGSDGQRVLLEQVCHLFNVQLQKLVHLIDVCEVLVDEIICRHLQLGTVQTLGQCADALRKTTNHNSSYICCMKRHNTSLTI